MIVTDQLLTAFEGFYIFTNLFHHILISGQPRRKKKDKTPKSSSSGSTTLSTVSIQAIVDKLKMQCVRSTTMKNYYSVWKTFDEFFLKLDIKPHKWEDRIVLFVAYLIEFKQVQLQTIQSYISALRNILLDDGFELNENKFLLSALTKACHFQNDTSMRSRLPIQKNLLHKIIHFMENHFSQQNQPYLAILYKTIFLTAYYGLFWVSEITLTQSNHTI